MDSFEWNKIFMALGFTVLGVFGINEFTHLVFTDAASDKPPVVAAVAPAEGGGAQAPAEEPQLDLGLLLASADIEAGKAVARQCVQCHSWDKGGPNKIGPNLWDIVGAKHAHLDGYAYSTALRNLPGQWDYAGLYAFLRRPAGYVPGTKMSYAGLRKQDDRINLIAYMRTWSEDPEPLPAPLPAAGEATPEAPAAAPAETPPG